MDVIASQVDPESDSFKRNAEHHRALVAELRARLAQVRQGGDAQARQRHAEQGKLFARERIDRLIDPDAPFLELSPLAAWEMYDGEAPSAGIVTGIGPIAGRACVS